MTDRIIALLDRHRLAIAIVAGLWFWTGCAVYAGFIDLPRIAPWFESAFFWAGAATNALWYGFASPRIAARRRALEDAR